MPRSSPSLFDRWSSSYDRPGLQRAIYRPIHDAVLRRVDGLAPRVVLDLGCGTGQLTNRLAERFPDASVIGLDMAAGMLARATRTAGAAPRGPAGYVRADAHSLPIAPGSVDLVVCTESFHWYEDQARAVAQIRDALAPLGRLLIVSIATATSVADQIVRNMTSAAGSTVRALPPRELRALLEGSAFEVLLQRRVPRLALAPWPVLTDARNAG